MASILKDIRAAFGDVEATPYMVVVERGGYEERVYPGRQWACTAMAGPSRHDLVTPMFRRLFSYISGRNEPNIRIDMTTPVVTYVEPLKKEDEDEERRRRRRGSRGGKGGDTIDTPNTTSNTTSSTSSPLSYTMSFLVPASHQNSPPTTADKKIFFERRRKMTVLARRFSGYLNDDVVRREMKVLRDAITSNGDEKDIDFERYYVAGYDPPFKLLGRRNEIWVVKKVWEEDEEEEDVVVKGTCGGDFVMVENEVEEVNGVVEAKEDGCGVENREVEGKGGEVVKENGVGEMNGVVKSGVKEGEEGGGSGGGGGDGDVKGDGNAMLFGF